MCNFRNRQIQLSLINCDPDRFQKKLLMLDKFMKMFELHDDDVIGLE